MKNVTRSFVLLPVTLAGVVWTASPLLVAGVAGSGQEQESRKPVAAVEAVPGAIVRWSVPGTRSCGVAGRTWKAVQETCYYPIDLERTPGVVTVARHGASGSVARARITVNSVSYGSENIELGDIPQAHPSKADLERNAREQALVAKLWKRPESAARFTLPLGPPLDPLPDANGFGATWIFNTTPPSTETHGGLDYAARTGTPVTAVADGTVVLAQDLFHAGNSVFIDHGNGLFTAYLHLSEVRARAGQDVRKGEVVGLVGETGRTTGPHLHFAVRWHGARVDPRLLLEDPAKIRSIGEGTGRQ